MTDTYKRLVRFHYYQALIERVNEKGQWIKESHFNVADWLAKLSDEGDIRRNVELSDCIAYIENVKFDKESFYSVRFFKLRDINIPSIVKEGKNSEPIPLEDDEYIGEDMNMLYDKKLGVCMIQSNRMSLSASRIAEWMSKKCEKGYRVSLLPIYNTKNLASFKKKKISNIDISFANIEENNSLQSLGDIIKGMRKFNGLTGHLTISVGKRTTQQLNNDGTLELITELRENREVVKSAKVKMKDDDKSRTEIVDLFDDVLHDYISFDVEVKKNLDFDEERLGMIQRYKERVDEITQALNMKG